MHEREIMFKKNLGSDPSDPEDKKKLATSYSRTSGRRTTLGDGALDFRVRNGNGYDSSSMVTSKRGKLGVKGKCDPLRDASRLEVKKIS